MTFQAGKVYKARKQGVPFLDSVSPGAWLRFTKPSEPLLFLGLTEKFYVKVLAGDGVVGYVYEGALVVEEE